VLLWNQLLIVSAVATLATTVIRACCGYHRRIRKRDLQILHEILESHDGFGHREHVELAWSYLRLYPIDEAADVMAAAIRRAARLHGAEDKYHESITHAWLHFVAVHIQRWGADTFEGFLGRNPELLDGSLIQHFYSLELILSERARASRIAPDLRPLPALA
jgi:hypothetical protein